MFCFELELWVELLLLKTIMITITNESSTTDDDSWNNWGIPFDYNDDSNDNDNDDDNDNKGNDDDNNNENNARNLNGNATMTKKKMKWQCRWWNRENDNLSACNADRDANFGADEIYHNNNDAEKNSDNDSNC